MSEIVLNSNQFFDNAAKLQKLFEDPLMIILGRTEHTKTVGHNSALFLYLLQYEFPDSAIVLTDPITFITSQRKSTILTQLKQKINVVIKQKEDDSSVLEYLKNKKFSIVDVKNLKGKFCELIINNIEYQEKTQEISNFFTVKDEKQYEYLSEVRGVTDNVFIRGKDMIVNWVMNESFISNRSVSSKIENVFDKMTDDSNFDLIYQPVIQTKKYDLTVFESDSGALNSNVLYRLGLRCNGYCSEKGRSLVFNADEETYNVYGKMFMERDEIVEQLVKALEEDNIKDLLESINAKGINVHSTGILQDEGINVLDSPKGIYAFCIDLRQKHDGTLLTLCDTVLIKGGNAHYVKDNIENYTFITHVISKKDTKSKQKEVEKNLQRHEHQKELMDSLIEEMLELYKTEDAPKANITLVKKRYVPYLKEANLPRNEILYVDRKNYAVLLPMNNYVLPFSIEMLKNVSKTDDGVLRINFNVNGPEDSIKSILYKCGNDYAEDLLQKITEMKKEFNINKETLDKENVTNLILVSGRKIALPGVFIRTDIKQRKSKANALELHENGFRYNNEGTAVDILFDNIKHTFFQEGTIENRVLINFHLKEPLYLPKKTMNVQIYRECSTRAMQDTGKVNDEYMEAMLDKEDENKRKESNKEFAMFIEKIESLTPLRVQIPSKSGSFDAVPYKGIVLIQPTTECLVNLVDFPSFVLTLSEIEVACFERMVLGIKTFDLIFVHKDKLKPVTQLLSIDVVNANKVKNFLDGKNIPFIETKINLQWNALMKEIMKDPYSFYENGAWCELQPHREDDEPEEEETESESENLTESSDSSTIDTTSMATSSNEDEISTDDESEQAEFSSEEESESDYKSKKQKRS